MRLRSLTVAVLSAVALVPLAGSPAAASSTSLVLADRAVASTLAVKSSARQRLGQRAALARVAAPPPSPALTTNPPARTEAQAYADRVLVATNAARARAGLRPVAADTCAGGYAESWAASLARAGSLSHQALRPILTACSARGVGENVAFGNVSPEAMVDMWMNSPGHRANILNAGFTHLGVGAVTTSAGRWYGVQVFLTR